MCFGEQEYYVGCFCPGNFVVTSRCRVLSCQTRVEERSVYIPGPCPRCRSTRPAGAQPQYHHRLPRRREGGGTRWESFNALTCYHRERRRVLERAVQAAARNYEASGRQRQYWTDYQCAITDLRDADAERQREETEYRTEEARLDDSETYEGW